MKKILFLFIVVLFSCKKGQIASPINQGKSCQIDISKLKDIEWKTKKTWYGNVKFLSNGDYWQGGQLNGTWVLNNGCDELKITVTNQSYLEDITYLTNDTLIIDNPVYYEIIFFK